ncbi:LacI family DNA-binding transcriptional regulator [Streptomyces sp. 8K308]|uniref:LacI family DNA-binding transcriptional regulator n=1 Tax=Streptomyces sp. 8K308 TaxID=2530388 RepID=UPI001FB5C16C|nr:LacI family DNA-binding transcriptional regulator [Streptomyces sp. 8K308]
MAGRGGGGRPTSRDVARLAGVSHTAVSFVFNGRAEGNLSAETQRRILDAAAKLNYRPDPVARGLRRRRTSVIGLITDEIASAPFAGRLLRGAMRTAWDRGHLVLTVDSAGDTEREDAAVAELLDRRVDGIIYAALAHRVARPPAGLDRTHAVLANCTAENGRFPAVIPAERAGGRAAAEALIGAGHRELALVGGMPDDIAYAGRLRGFHDALSAAGLTAGQDRILPTGSEISSGYQAATRLLGDRAAADRPTGISCYNDRVAAGVLHAAARLGLDVPGDLSVVGFDNQEHMVEFLTPPLTTVALPHAAMGELAAATLLDAIEAGKQPPVEVRELPCPLIARESVGPAPGR